MSDKSKEKKFNDSIYGTIKFPEVIVRIIDTLQCQRLRDLKQTGNCHYVYSCATHTRFEHSLGVANLCFTLAKDFKDNHANSNIDDKDVICVTIAGLCHDLGHGPMSHLWEHFVHTASPNADWHHEDNTVKMFDRLIEVNNLRPVLENLAGINERDLIFIKELFGGPLESGRPSRKYMEKNDDWAKEYARDWPYQGRGKDKCFLYEIVANKLSGVDVDKFDYLQRDEHYFNVVGHKRSFNRFQQSIKLLDWQGLKRICLRDKEQHIIQGLFADRATLHKQGYQHRVTKIVDQMMIDAWLLADDHVKIKGQNGAMFSLSEARNDVVAFQALTDDVNTRIRLSEDTSPEVLKAKHLLDRISKRAFYHTLGATSKEKLRGEWKTSELEGKVRAYVKCQKASIDVEEIAVLEAKGGIPVPGFPLFDRNDQLILKEDAQNVNENIMFDNYFIISKSEDEKQLANSKSLVQEFLRDVEK